MTEEIHYTSNAAIFTTMPTDSLLLNLKKLLALRSAHITDRTLETALTLCKAEVNKRLFGIEHPNAPQPVTYTIKPKTKHEQRTRKHYSAGAMHQLAMQNEAHGFNSQPQAIPV